MSTSGLSDGTAGARIYEQGYHRYDGPRLGPGAAVRSTALHTLRFILGLRRRARSKLIPWGVVALTYLPALGFVAAVTFLPAAARQVADQVLPGPEAYLGGTILLIYLAAAVAGPAALCGDRRSGAIALYLSSPLDRRTYLAAKSAAVAGLLGLVTIGPPLLYVLGLVVAGGGPGGPAAVGAAVGRTVAAGIVVTLVLGALSLAAGSLTDRQTAAGGIVVLYALVSNAVMSTVVFALDAPDALLLLDVSQAGLQAVAVIYGQELQTALPPPVVVLGALAWVGVLGALTWLRYRRLRVTR